MSAGDPREVRREAGRAAVLAQVEFLHQQHGRVRSEWKADGSRVTAADRAISAGILGALAAAFPGDDLCTEESEESGERELRARFAWVLDPIDGTNNFALGLPHCAIALALLEEGVPVHGWVYDASRRRLMEGGPGHGVRDGGESASAATGPFTPQSLVAVHTPADPRWAHEAAEVLKQCKIRALGSSTLHLAYVAAGLLDAVVDHNVKVWDIAAAVPLAVAAGVQIDWQVAEPFPLRRFTVDAERIRYRAGRPEACAALAAIVGAVTPRGLPGAGIPSDRRAS